MWAYEKKLQYPVNIKCTNPALAKIIITQYGGPDCKKIYISGIEKNLYTAVAPIKYDPFDNGFQERIFYCFGYSG